MFLFFWKFYYLFWIFWKQVLVGFLDKAFSTSLDNFEYSFLCEKFCQMYLWVIDLEQLWNAETTLKRTKYEFMFL